MRITNERYLSIENIIERDAIKPPPAVLYECNETISMDINKGEIIMTKKRNIILSIGIMAIVLMIGGGLGIYYFSPSNYIAIDVNPSIELHTNRLNQVTSINPVNEDAKQLMAGYVMADKSLETVIEDIVDRMILNGYLAADKDNQILITTEDNDAAAQLSAKINTIISAYLTERQLDANVLQQGIKINTQSIDSAHEDNVSAGKMTIIQKIMENDNSITLDELLNMRISDLLTLAANKNVDLTGLVTGTANQEDGQNDGTYEDQQDNENDGDKEDQQDIEGENDSDKEDQQDIENENDDEDQKDIENENDNDDEDQQDIEDENDSDDEDQQDIEDENDSYYEDQRDIEHENDNDYEEQYNYENEDNNEDQHDYESKNEDKHTYGNYKNEDQQDYENDSNHENSHDEDED